MTTATAGRELGWRRLRGRATVLALTASAVGAIGAALGTVVVGRLAERPSWTLVGLLAACVVGAGVLDTAGRTIWSAVVDRAEGRARVDLLDAVMHQTLTDLEEQPVGEILDRVDDDTHETGSLLRNSGWVVIRLALGAIPLLVVAGLTWTPAWFLFPATAALVFLVVRGLLGPVAELRVIEEAAWSDHAAAMEEGVAARDDLRTSLGQGFVVRRSAQLAAVVHARFSEVLELDVRMTRRSGLVLHGLLATTVVVGVAALAGDAGSIATLVTLFAVTSTFVGQVARATHQLPDIQAGVGAVTRLRSVLAAPAEAVGGLGLGHDRLDVEFRDVRFSYDDGPFALDGVTFTVPAGTTCALVGRSGSGKSTLASLLSRAVDPDPGTVFVGGVDVLHLDLDVLRSAVGVVTQRTEIIAGTLAENIALFADVPRSRIEAALDELGLSAWVGRLPDGLDTELGPGGTALSAGEEQLVSFARLLVRDVGIIVLDEATARMDPMTEAAVVRASRRLLEGRTGLVVAHRLQTTERAGAVAVFDDGRVVQHGARSELAATDGAFRRLLDSAAGADDATSTAVAGDGATDRSDGGLVAGGPGSGSGGGASRSAPSAGSGGSSADGRRGPSSANPVPASGSTALAERPEVVATGAIGAVRRVGTPPPERRTGSGPGLARGTWSAIRIHPRWGLAGVVLFLAASITGAHGALTGWSWGRLVVELEAGRDAPLLVVAVVASLLCAPFLLGEAIDRYPKWWIAVMLRVRTSVLVGQTRQDRLAPTPPGEVVARAMDSDRFARYADRWVDFANGLVIALVTAIAGGSVLAGAVLISVMVASATVSAVGAPSAGRSAAASSTARARFGRSLVSSLDSIRTVKLAGATPDVHRHLRAVDEQRIGAAVREHRIQAILDGLPHVLVQAGVVAAWAVHVAGGWGLGTALLVSGAVSGFDWFGRVAGAVITEAPGVRAWQAETCRLAAGDDLMTVPAGVDLVSGDAPGAEPTVGGEFGELAVAGFSAVHDDGTIGAHGIDLRVRRGELVLLLGTVGSGKSSLLSALAGLVSSTGQVRWDGVEIEDRERFLRPPRVAHVAQVPRVLSGTFADNVHLGHDRAVAPAIAGARLGRDVADAGGVHAVIGHRGVRLSGGQVQRLALARALAVSAHVLIADDVSSALDAATEVELWESLRERGLTVIGSTSKRAALARADRVVVMVDGEIAATGPWDRLAPAWGHLAG
ncbi:ATP-binding cassette domain-containing protein [Ilumatobacter sp.]|uniref:ATP-binding cassette domain-containing protein n=1 Tax=Ilumatobacter sp. TaxID=1967498 RepID=UPI003B52F06B